ncbi:MAG: 30S ribosomal protein S16 [Deltaproteobacteria bacterium]|nr:30S ribosomal protein S16 [Deltaproteobacteria bacterium]
MAVKIRLSRGGTKKKAVYRIVVADSRFPRDGRFLDVVGTYDPKKNPPLVTFKNERIAQWLKKGATVTNTVGTLLKKAGITAGSGNPL